MKKLFTAALLVLAFQVPSFAQSEITGPIDLLTAVEIALENNLTLKRTEINQGNFEAELLANQGRRIPSLSSGVFPGYRWGRSINPVTNLFETRRIGNINVTANSSLPIFNGMRINNSIAQARKNLEAGQYSLQATRNTITLSVINLFIDVVFNREQVKIAENQLKTTSEQLERTKKLVAAGSLPLTNQLDLQSQWSSVSQVGLNSSHGDSIYGGF